MNQNLMKLEKSASIEFMQKAEEIKSSGKTVLSLAGGEPDFDTPKKICDAAVGAIYSGDTHYAVGKGLYPLRKKISTKMWEDNKVLCTPDDIIITPGGKFGIYMAVNAVINQGDEVIVFNPAWVSYGPIIKACGGNPVYIQLDYKKNYVLEEEKIIANITEKTKAIILNYPNNPTGKLLSKEEADVLEGIVKKYDLYVISDEIYEKIVYDGRKNVSLASYDSIRDRVITINGFSKAYAMTGWRLGYTVATKELTDVMYKLYTHTITGTSPFIQRGAIKAFDCVDDVEMMSKEYETRRNYFVTELNKIEGITCRMPEGAFYAWVKFDTDKTADEIANEILEQTGVIGVPGNSYGEYDETCIRFSFACKMEELKKAIEMLKRYRI